MKNFNFDNYPRLQEFLDRFYPGWVELDDDIMTQYGDWLLSIGKPTATTKTYSPISEVRELEDRWEEEMSRPLRTFSGLRY